MATCLFGERDAKTALAALESAYERAKANLATATDMTRPEQVRMMAAAQVGEDAIQAAKASARLAGYGFYLSGFLGGAGVPDPPRPNFYDDLRQRLEAEAAKHGQLTLEQCIDRLEHMPEEAPVMYVAGHITDFLTASLTSYRGYYEDLAIEPSDDGDGTLTAPKLVEALRGAIGQTFSGWKGGEYTMRDHTRVWVSESGRASGLRVTHIEYDGAVVKVHTVEDS